MKKLTIVLGGLISILFATSAPAQTPIEQARAFQVNAAHTGSITSPGLEPPFRQKWSINFGDFVDTNKPDVTATATPNNVDQRSDPVTVTISGHVTDTVSSFQPGSASFVVVDEYGVTQPTGPVVLNASGIYLFTLTLPATKNAGDRSHVYTITVTGSDQAGNTNSDSATLRIN